MRFGEEGADSASLAWHGVKILCLPKEQPTGAQQAFTLTVTAEDGTTGRSAKFHVNIEATLDGCPDGPPEIDAKMLHKWWDETTHIRKAPVDRDGNTPRSIKDDAGGMRGVNIKRHPSQHEEILRELKSFPSSVAGVREFFKDLTVWQCVGDKCGNVVAQVSKFGWYFDPVQKRAGFSMAKYTKSLDEKLSTNMLMRERFELCDQVLQIMLKLQEEFPFLMFPDVKPKNFLCQTQTVNHEIIVLTDLDDVRRVGSKVGTYTEPYRHPEWKDGVPTEKRFEQYAVVVTLLQILLGMQSKVRFRFINCAHPCVASGAPSAYHRVPCLIEFLTAFDHPRRWNCGPQWRR